MGSEKNIADKLRRKMETRREEKRKDQMDFALDFDRVYQEFFQIKKILLGNNDASLSEADMRVLRQALRHLEKDEEQERNMEDHYKAIQKQNDQARISIENQVARVRWEIARFSAVLSAAIQRVLNIPKINYAINNLVTRISEHKDILVQELKNKWQEIKKDNIPSFGEFLDKEINNFKTKIAVKTEKLVFTKFLKSQQSIRNDFKNACKEGADVSVVLNHAGLMKLFADVAKVQMLQVRKTKMMHDPKKLEDHGEALKNKVDKIAELRTKEVCHKWKVQAQRRILRDFACTPNQYR